MNVTVTGGSVKYGRTVNKGDFNSSRGDVELTFMVEEGTDPHDAIHHVKKMAAEHLHHMLDVGMPKADTIHNAPAAKAPAEKTAPAKPAAPKMPAARGRPPAVKEPEEIMDDVLGLEASKAAEKADDGLDDLMGTGEPEVREITDKELVDATQKRQDTVRNSPAIRKLLTSLGIVQPPGRLIDLPQDKRQAYLDGLLEIKPLA